MVYCQATPLPVSEFTLRSSSQELFGRAILSKPLWTEPRMGGTSSARIQLHYSANLALVIELKNCRLTLHGSY